MTETPATYDCGAGCTCDAVHDLAAERTELMEEMAAALERALDTLSGIGVGTISGDGARHAALWGAMALEAVLAKYRGEEGHHAN